MRTYRTLLIVMLAMLISCKAKGPEELILRNWKISSVSDSPDRKPSDSLLNDSFKDLNVEFKEDGKFTANKETSDSSKGTWWISTDGKELYTKEERMPLNDTLKIVEISKDKLILNPRRGSDTVLIMTFVPKK
jgi:hypothetical protein